MSRQSAVVSVILSIALLSVVAFGQRDGVPTFSAADIHDTDVVNLTTLIPTINIPVVTKSGAIPLDITLTAQQYCYTFGQVGSYLRECNGEFDAYASGLLRAWFTYSRAQPASGACPNGGSATSYSNWYLLTSDGLDAHPINTNVAIVINDPAHSGLPQGNCTGPYSINAVTIDGSGYTVNFSVPAGTLTPFTASAGDTFSVTAPDGSSINGLSASTTITDTFGNTESVSAAGNSWAYTDSLGVANTAKTTITGDRPTSLNGSVQYLDEREYPNHHSTKKHHRIRNIYCG